MSSDVQPLSEIANIQGGYAFKSADFGDEGIAVIKIANIQPPLVSLGGVDRVKPSCVSGLERFELNDGDILMAMTGATVGKVGRFKRKERAFLNQRVARITARDGKEFDDFIYAVLSLNGFDKKIENASAGSAQPNISAAGIGSILINKVSRDDKLSIGKLAKSIDDRITLLRETNATLEAIAQALFKSWFVDFEPVRAKAAGLEPQGMDAIIAGLFPDGFEKSELGLVPNEWTIERIDNVAEIVKGKSYKSTELTESHHTALVTLKSFSRGGGFRLDGFKPYTGSYKLAQVVVPGDLIIAYTDVTQAAELIGKPAIVVGVQDYQTLVASLDVGIVRPCSPRVSRQYLYGLFCTDLFQSHTFAHTSGTTVLHLAKDGVGSYQFACPPQKLVQFFSETTDALSKRCQSNIDQIRTLTQLRETLLPRLISGQLRLPEAEAQIEALYA
ncbi:restriction endonuclease subunit S [Pseudomonas iridis]|uniref:restriction endonuclease subunit S n=1 Tax=Pseudomonas iridis TaxID=2710587 RepID=UPI0037F2BE4F